MTSTLNLEGVLSDFTDNWFESWMDLTSFHFDEARRRVDFVIESERREEAILKWKFGCFQSVDVPVYGDRVTIDPVFAMRSTIDKDERMFFVQEVKVKARGVAINGTQGLIELDTSERVTCKVTRIFQNEFMHHLACPFFDSMSV